MVSAVRRQSAGRLSRPLRRNTHAPGVPARMHAQTMPCALPRQRHALGAPTLKAHLSTTNCAEPEMASRRGVGPLQSEHHRTFEARQAHATHAFLSPAPPPLLTTSPTTHHLRAALLSSWSGTLPLGTPSQLSFASTVARAHTRCHSAGPPCCAPLSAMGACAERRLFVYAQRWCARLLQTRQVSS